MGYCSCYVLHVNCQLSCPLPRTRQKSDNGDYVNCHTLTPRRAITNYHESVTRNPQGNASPLPLVHQRRTPGRRLLST